MTATVRPPTTAPAPAATGGELTGTGNLLRLFLRLSRRQIAIWALAFLALVALSVVALEETYPDAAALQARAVLLESPAAVMMTGPAFALEDYTFGAMIANELSLWLLLPAAIMSVLLAVRHTRAEEESGRLELLRSLPVGRYAPAVAAMLTVALADVAVGAATTAGLVITGMPAADSLALGLATALTGLVFGAVAAVTAQVTEHARTASGLALGALAAAFLVRGVGDVIERTGSWLSWLSPLAWAQQTRVFVDLRWWPLALSAGTTLVLLLLAASLARRRDLGAGLRAARPGPAQASRALLAPAGLARRLVSGTFVAWAVAMFLFALAFGALASSLDDVIADIPAMGEWIELDLDDLTRSFAAVILSFLALCPAALAVSGVLRLRAEEREGRLEGVLASGSSRTGVLGRWALVVAVESALVQVLLGIGAGLGVSAGTGEVAWVGELTAASLAYLPAVLLLGGVAVALVGLAPRLASLAWVPVVWAALVVFLGELLGLPSWARDLSPLTHTPLVPGAALTAGPLAVMTVLALGLAAAGLLGLHRRDVGTA
ncbi:polyketide antibiotic transporter [Georgenia wutianyii]|uniref:Polyketide antibiotic transporter n=1 Tax=Georgenia wutianyii TaxID=2585135 RepID=A0ABX5VJJ2_9MICO|nr:polyketide antibiotic transporter [Georgenia wutianyii]